MANNSIRCVIYARHSSEGEQAIDRQLETVEAYLDPSRESGLRARGPVGSAQSFARRFGTNHGNLQPKSGDDSDHGKLKVREQPVNDSFLAP